MQNRDHHIQYSIELSTRTRTLTTELTFEATDDTTENFVLLNSHDILFNEVEPVINAIYRGMLFSVNVLLYKDKILVDSTD